MFAGKEQHFQSLETMLRYIDDTREIDPKGYDYARQDTDTDFFGPMIPRFLEHCRTLGGEFPALVARVDALVDALQPELPPTETVKRVRTWGKQGSSINPHRVLRGQLSTAWRKTRKDTSLSYQGVVSVVVPTGYAARMSQNTIAWMAAVPLALAQAIEASGRRCELWGFCYTPYNSYKGHVPFRSLVCLKTADEPWSLHGPVYTIHRAFFRRLVIRIMEVLGPVSGPHGWMGYDQATFNTQAKDALETFAGIPASRVLCGPWPMSHKIDSTRAAVAWLSDTLARLNTHQAELDLVLEEG